MEVESETQINILASYMKTVIIHLKVDQLTMHIQ